jgi:hypothetical protein
VSSVAYKQIIFVESALLLTFFTWKTNWQVGHDRPFVCSQQISYSGNLAGFCKQAFSMRPKTLGRFIEAKTFLNNTMSWDLCLFGKSLENFAYSAKVSDLDILLGNVFGRIWPKTVGIVYFFLIYKCHNKKFVYSIWQTTAFHYSVKV